MIKIIFVPTWLCNLRCSYCDYKITAVDYSGSYKADIFGIERIILRELSADEWLKLLDRFRPYHLELTGGEPTCWNNLPLLLDNLPTDCKWSITSNTLNRNIINKLNSNACISWTASYHYGHNDIFVNNLGLLKSKGFRTSVTIVITPDNFEQALDTIKWLTKFGFIINIHPVIKQENVWDGYDELWNKIQKLTGVKVVKTIDKKWAVKYYNKCSAGTDYFIALPDGTMERCLSYYVSGSNPIPLSEFVLKKEKYPCEYKCIFPCDVERAKEQ